MIQRGVREHEIEMAVRILGGSHVGDAGPKVGTAPGCRSHHPRRDVHSVYLCRAFGQEMHEALTDRLVEEVGLQSPACSEVSEPFCDEAGVKAVAVGTPEGWSAASDEG